MPIDFVCSQCFKLLRVPDGSAGRPCQCPECGAIVTVPRAHTRPQTSELASSGNAALDDGKLRVTCPNCNHLLVCDTGLQGTRGQCRQCNHIFTIQTARANQAATVEQSGGIVFSCPKCNQLFEGTQEMQGRKGKCHVCQTVFAIQLRNREAESSPQEGKSLAASHRPHLPTGESQGKPAGGSSQTATTVLNSAEPRDQALAKAVSARAERAIRLTCGACQGVLEVPGSSAGLETICPFCQKLLRIPGKGKAAPRAIQKKNAVSNSSSEPQSSTGNPISDSNLALWDELLPNTSSSPQADPLAGAIFPANPYASAFGGQAWSVPAAGTGKRVSFQKTFKLLFERSFPTCLLGFVQYVLAGIPIGLMLGVITLIAMVLAGSGIRLSPTSAAIFVIVLYVALLLCALFSSTAAMCCACNVALHAVRKKRITSSIFFGGFDIAVPMMLVVLGLTLFGWAVMVGLLLLFGAALGGFETAQASGINAGQQPSVFPVLMACLIGLPAITLPSLAFCFTPFAMLDGQGLFEAIGTSFRMFFTNILAIVGTTLVFMLGFTLFGAITCSLGSSLLVALPLFLVACMYVQIKT